MEFELIAMDARTRCDKPDQCIRRIEGARNYFYHKFDIAFGIAFAQLEISIPTTTHSARWKNLRTNIANTLQKHYSGVE